MPRVPNPYNSIEKRIELQMGDFKVMSIQQSSQNSPNIASGGSSIASPQLLKKARTLEIVTSPIRKEANSMAMSPSSSKSKGPIIDAKSISDKVIVDEMRSVAKIKAADIHGKAAQRQFSIESDKKKKKN